MAKQKKEEGEVTVVGQDVKIEPTEFSLSKDSIVDVAVTVVSLEKDPFHKDGEEFQMAKKTAETLAAKGWVKIKE